MHVAELSGGCGVSINPNSGKVGSGLYYGNSIIMTFGGANGADHTVVVTGTAVING